MAAPLVALKNERPSIGLLVASLASTYQEQIVHGALEHARARNCNLIVFSGGPFGNPSITAAFRSRVFELASPEFFDGIIAPMGSLSRYIRADEAGEILARFAPRPVVTINSDVPGYANIALDNSGGMYAMLEHLISAHACRRFAFARGQNDHLSSNEKEAAFRAALAAHGLAFDESMLIYSELKKNVPVDGIAALMAHPDGPPDAIVSTNDGQAMIIIAQLKSMGLRVPEDVAVTGCMGSEDGLFFNPPLSSVSEPNYDLGWYAAKAVIDAIEGLPVETRLLPTQLIIRRSCGCGQGAHPVAADLLALEDLQPTGVRQVESLLAPLLHQMHAGLLLEARQHIQSAELDALVAALGQTLASDDPAPFLSVLQAHLAAARQADVLHAWAGFAQIIHKQLSQSNVRIKSALCGALFALVEQANERLITAGKYAVTQHVSVMRDIWLELNARFDFEKVARVLARELAINDCYVSLLDKVGDLSGGATILLAMRDGEVLPIGDARCLPRQVVPQEAGYYEDTKALLILPLSFQNKLLGTFTVSLDKLRGVLYESLRALFSGTVQNRLNLRESREAEEKFSDIALSAADWLWELDIDGRFSYSSDGALRVLGYHPEDLRGRSMFEFFLDSEANSRAEAQARMLDHAGFATLDFHLRHQDGQLRVLKASGKPVIKAGTVVGYRGAFKDVTESQQQEARILALAYRDQLTDLPNRSLFNDRFQLAMAAAQRDDHQLAILFLDLDGFKLVNDSMGHEAGDQLLRAVAERLQGCVRDVDTLARFGGDEFIVALPRIDGLEDAAHVAQRIVDAFEQPFEVRNQQIFITTSVGIARYPNDGDSTETLLKNADKAMYKAKEHGKNRYTLYEGNLEEDLLRTVALRELVRKALRQSRFYLLYQPQIDSQTRQIVGVEALIRIAVEAGPPVSPAEFIPIAEDMGLIDEIGLWVFDKVCQQQVLWASQGQLINCSFNVSAKQLRKRNLAEQFIEVMHKHGARPEYLTLEITESAVIDSEDTARRSLQRLADCGMSIAIDDFGTGYASLSVLRKFPVSLVKIDRSFINDCVASEEGASMVWAIVLMAKSLNMTLVAEGVETDSQAGFLQSIGCQQMQGFYFARPLPATEIPAYSQALADTSGSKPLP